MTLSNPFRSAPAHWLRTITVALTIPFMAFYSMGLMAWVIQSSMFSSSVLMVLAAIPYSVMVIFAGAVFSHPTLYLLVSALGIIAALLMMWRDQWPWRLVGFALALAVVAFPFVFGYRPALTAAPGYRMWHVTQPAWIESVTRMALNLTEQRTCEYAIEGWDNTDVLYYASTCGAETRHWQFDPASGTSTQVDGITNTTPGTIVPRPELLTMVRAGGVSPQSAEPSTRELYLHSEGWRSPSGQFIALIARHVYGPEDVLIVASGR